MKRLLIVITTIIICILLDGCNKPADMRNETYELGLKALATADAYFDAELTEKTAETKFDIIHDRLMDMQDVDEDSDSSIITQAVAYKISALYFALQMHTSGDESYNYDVLIESRNELAKTLNQIEK